MSLFLNSRQARAFGPRRLSVDGALLCVTLAACSSGGSSARPDAAADVAGIDRAAGSGGTAGQDVGNNEDADDPVDFNPALPEVPASNISCNQIRLCTVNCENKSCVDACVARGTAAAKVLFGAWATCTAGECTDVSDINCFCQASCFGGSPCESETTDCTENETDFVCDELCH